MSMALYRKYRSKSLDEIVGQSHVTDILARSLAKGIVAHAYLLTGPRGVGKTSIARILAHEINQLPYSDDVSHLDIIEIDAASNNGVEDVRDLREKVQVAPVSAAKKIYIIDEVHMLSKAAFNALLKTLEEPPEHTVFILATTDADKLPATIISRTQRFNFRTISVPDAIQHLKHIAAQEKIRIDDDALELITIRGEGSFRDSISLLDQLRSIADEKTGITRQLAEQALGLAPAELIQKLLDAYEAKELKTIVELLDESDRQGIQATMLTIQLTQIVRKEMVKKPHLISLLDQLLEVAKSPYPNLKLLTILSSHAAPKLKAAALSAPPAEVSAPIAELERQAMEEILPGKNVEVGTSALKQAAARRDISAPTSLQSAKLAALRQSSTGQEITTEISGGDDSVSSPEIPTSATPARVASGGAAPTESSALARASVGADRMTGPAGSDLRGDSRGISDDGSGGNNEQEKERQRLTLDWQQLIDHAREHYVAVYSVLSKCGYELSGDTLVIYTKNAFYKKKLDDSKHRINLQKSLDEIGAGGLTIETIPAPAPPKDSQAALVAAIMGGGEEVTL